MSASPFRLGKQDHRPLWQKKLVEHWYQKKSLPIAWVWLLKCLSKITALWFLLKLKYIKKNHHTNHQNNTTPPVIVVGNLIVGGAGKTPIVRCLVEALKKRGKHPAIISRGYGRQTTSLTLYHPSENLSRKLLAQRLGDEPAWLAQSLQCPIAVDADRLNALKSLTNAYPEIDIVISDDGLQHQKLPRNFEIAVFDERGVGNGELLPLGPLREPLNNIRRVDACILSNGFWDPRVLAAYTAHNHLYATELKFKAWRNHRTHKSLSIEEAKKQWKKRSIVAVVGLANPDKFLNLIKTQGITFEKLILPDHYNYNIGFLAQLSYDIILTTGKDAVKWQEDQRVWIADIEFNLPETLLDALEDKLREPKII